MGKQREWCVQGQWCRMRCRAVRESEKRVISKGMSVMANLTPSLTDKSSAVRMGAEAGNLQTVAVECSGV